MIINRFFYAPPAPVYTVSTFAPSLVAKAGSNAAASNYLSTVAAYHDGSFNGGGADDTAFNSAYAPYVSTLPSGGSGHDSAGEYTITPPVYVSSSTATSGSFTLSRNGSSFTGSWACSSPATPVMVKASVSGSYPAKHYYFVVLCSSVGFSASYTNINGTYSYDSSFMTCGLYGVNPWTVQQAGASAVSYSMPSVSMIYGGDNYCWKDAPITSTPTRTSVDSSVVSTSFPVSSRVNTVINNYATKEGDTYNYITNKPIFDEDTLVFFNPLTGVSFNVTGWYYDYSTRRYTLTYTDNSVSKTATVEYGYNYITVTAAGAANNYYYLA